MTDTKIEPALTAEEWELWETQRRILVQSGTQITYAWGQKGHLNAQQIAALALHGQPFGFTRADVRFLREVAFSLKESDASNLAARIEALLPPE